MKNIDSQIPISNNNWLNFDINTVTEIINSLSKDVLTKIKSIKKLGKYSDLIYAPFCILLGQNKKNILNIKGLKWKEIAGKILNEPNLISKIQNLEYETFLDSDILEAFYFLNLPELDIKIVSKFSIDLVKLIIWCQNVVSYHILVHPYTYRNDTGLITQGSDIHKFAERIDYLITRFYLFKRFLIKLKITKIPLADYVFNLQHTKYINNEQITFNPFEQLSTELIGFIFSYIPFKTSFNYMTLSKAFYKGFINSVEIISNDLYKNVYLFKYRNYKKLIKKFPFMFEYNIHSIYFHMLDDILNSKCDNYGNLFIPFLSKDHCSYIKMIKKETFYIQKICKVFCLICNINPERFSSAKGEIKIIYINKIKKLIINNKLQKLMRQIDKLDISDDKLNEIKYELSPLYNISVIEEIKKCNQGIYQLLLWEICVLEYNKNFNCFDFVDLEMYTSEMNEINYYVKLMEYLKYNLKIKYYFLSKNVPEFRFGNMYGDLKNELIENNLLKEELLESTNAEYEKIASLYFQKKKYIPFTKKHLFYEKILLKIISLSLNDMNDNMTNPHEIFLPNKKDNFLYNGGNITNQSFQLGTIKEEQINIDKCSLNKAYSNHNKHIQYTNNKSIHYTMNNNNNNIKNNDKMNFNKLPNIYIIKYILFYLDVQNLPLFSLVSKNCSICVKTHMLIRIHFLGNEKKIIESQKEDIISIILAKKENYYKEYEIKEPDLKYSQKLLNRINKEDICNLKFLYKKHNKKYEILIAPFVLLMGKRARCIYKADGLKQISFFEPARELFNDKHIEQKIKKFQLETIPPSTYREVVKMLEHEDFSEKSLKHYSNDIRHLIEWMKGVIEAHRVIRKYSFNENELSILDEDEINVCEEMDTIDLLHYKLVRYTATYCKEYENDAMEIMKDMDLEMEMERDNNDI